MKERKADNRSSANKIYCDIHNFFKKEKHSMSKRVLSLLMALVLCFSMLPAAALADECTAADNTDAAAEQENVPAVLTANAEDKPLGDGTESSPYLISAPNELKWFRDTVNGGKTDICAKLTADIAYKRYVSKPEPKWDPIGTAEKQYTGTFDGNGFRISMDSLVNEEDASDETKDWGLFGYIGSAGKVQDLNVDIQNLGRNHTTLIASQIGMLAAYNAGTVERCTAINSYQFYVSGTVGLLVYQNDGTVQDCIAKLGFSHENIGNVGGVVYQNNGTIRSCFFNTSNNTAVANGGMNNHAFAFEKGDGSSIQNCYYRYYRPIEDNTEGVTQLRNDEFNSGKATVMLNNDGDEKGSKTDPWRINSDSDPRLNKTDSRVYYDSESQQYVIEGKPHMHNDAEFTKVTALSDIKSSGRYCIDDDISLDSTWTVNGDVTLCLNGKTITSDSGITAIKLESGAGLTLVDCSTDKTGKLNGGEIGVLVNGGSFDMQGGEISGCEIGVSVTGGTLTLSGSAKVIDNPVDDANGKHNILLAENQKIFFGELSTDSKFGISAVGQSDLVGNARITVTDENGKRYFSHLAADGFKDDGTGFELYLDVETVTLGKQNVHTHCICGDSSKTVNGHTHNDEDVTFKPWT